LLILREFILRVDSINGAFGFTKCAVDAFIGVNDQKIWAFIEAVYGTNFDAVSMFAFDTVFYNNEGHSVSLISLIR